MKVVSSSCLNIQVVLPAQMNFPYIQQKQIKALRAAQCCQATVFLISNLKEEFQRWIQNLHIPNRRYLNQPQNFLKIRTDAFKNGWGAVCLGIPTGGEWNLQEQQLHINVLQIKAVKLALLAYHKQFQMKAIHLWIDNTTDLSYLVKMVGTKSKYLVELAKEIWKCFLHHGKKITAECLSSSINVEVDWQSRNSKNHSEWKLLPEIFQRICQITGRPEMDLFASQLSVQLPPYIAWKPGPYSQKTDAMQQILFNQYLYAFPPFSIINKILRNVA